MLCWCVKDPLGVLLPYTMQYCKSLAEEQAIERWGQPTWDMMKLRGFSVVIVEVKEYA
jgi:hypothetical protein